MDLYGDIRMLSENTLKKLQQVKESCAIVDIETVAWDENRVEIDIKTDFDKYVAKAEIKWVGIFSYKFNELFIYNAVTHKQDILDMLEEHQVLIGHNLEDFDYPILLNNNYIVNKEGTTILDTMVTLGKSSFYTKKGFPFKQRGILMDYDFPSNSLRNMAAEMKLECQKGEIDYRIFQQNIWNETETKEITVYLTDDVMSVKQMMDILWKYWLPFTQFLPEKSILDLSWIKGSIASVIYKAACHLLGEEPTYADRTEVDPNVEEIGGNVILPKVEEANNVYIVDVNSLYPHCFTLFNLFSEIPAHIDGPYVWKGNDVFKVRGRYDISHPHPLSALVKDFLQKRANLKKTDPKNPLVYTYKIFLNGLYGVVRSAIFEKVHKPNAGHDCCLIGQQIQKIMETKMAEYGFETIAGDTDAIHVRAIDENNSNEKYVKECLQKIVNYILENTPFKVDTFNISIEKKTDYILYPFEKAPIVGEDGKNVKVKNRLVYEKKPKKKNYLYLYTEKDGTKKIEIKGLPIKKNNSTKLALAIYNDILEKKIIEKGSAKFPKEEIDSLVNEYLKKPDAMDYISVEYNVKSCSSYKLETQIQSQISRGYFGGGSGTIRLIKNTKCGKAGKGVRYCSLSEAIENKLTVEDLDLTRPFNELAPFIYEN